MTNRKQTKRKRLPLNIPNIVIYTYTTLSRLHHQPAEVITIPELCIDRGCRNPGDHYTFDGQIFYQGAPHRG